MQRPIPCVFVSILHAGYLQGHPFGWPSLANVFLGYWIARWQSLQTLVAHPCVVVVIFVLYAGGIVGTPCCCITCCNSDMHNTHTRWMLLHNPPTLAKTYQLSYTSTRSSSGLIANTQLLPRCQLMACCPSLDRMTYLYSYTPLAGKSTLTCHRSPSDHWSSGACCSTQLPVGLM